MKLSIVIPVYNVENTLDRCVESVLHQGIGDFEVILVDDGSRDRSAAICDEWQAKDAHILVIHQENRGLSAARNAGISRATGELITFVDSDDFLKEGTYSGIIALAERYDIVEYPVCRFHQSSSQQIISFSDKVYTDPKRYWLDAKGYSHTYACNKLYKRSLFDNIRFPEGQVFEDAATLPRLLQTARNICTVNQGLYYYTLNEKGITATANGKELKNLLDSHIHTMRQWNDTLYYMHVLNIQMDVCELSGEAPTLPFMRINPLAKRLPARLRVKALLLDLFGINGICIINKAIHQWKKPRS